MLRYLNENRLWFMLMILALLAAIVFTGVGRRAGKPTAQQIALAGQGWQTDYAQAVGQSLATGKPILVDFTADWCPPCQYMKYHIFTQESVRQRLAEDFVAYRADVTAVHSPGYPLLEKYEVNATPTLLVLDATGRELARQVGALPEEDLLQWLSEHAAKLPPVVEAASQPAQDASHSSSPGDALPSTP